LDLSKLLNLPGLDDKNFVTGYVLPVLLAALAAAWIFRDVSGLEPLRSLPTAGTLINVAYLGLALWLAALFLQAANNFLYGLFEGYYFPISNLAFLRRRHIGRLYFLRSRYEALMTDWRHAVETGVAYSEDRRHEMAHLRLQMLLRYPSRAQEVMPTGFGNAVRAFESYPRDMYGVDGTAIMLRLNAVVPTDFSARIDAARAQVNLYVNIAFLAFIVGVLALGRVTEQVSEYHPAIRRVFSEAETGRPIIAAVVGLLVAFLAYRAATTCITVWGNLVMSTFDLYLPKLLHQMGYVLPPAENEQKEFWRELSAFILYRQPMTPGRWTRHPTDAAEPGEEGLDDSK
jgi:hypothetical protein